MVSIFAFLVALCDSFWLQAIHTVRIRHSISRFRGINPTYVTLTVATAQALRGFGWVPVCMVIVFNIIWGSYAWVYHDTILEVQSVILICYGFIMAGIKLFAPYLTSVVETSPVR